MRASLRDLRSPRKNYKSTIEDDLKKLIIMDNLAPDQERDAGVRSGLHGGGGRREKEGGRRAGLPTVIRPLPAGPRPSVLASPVQVDAALGQDSGLTSVRDGSTV